MPRSNWLFAPRHAFRHSPRRRTSLRSWRPAALRRPSFEPLEERTPLAVLTVNSPLDNNTGGDGLVTLREAIIAANTNATTDLGHTGSGADTIEFDSAVFGTPKTLQLMFGELVIGEELTINGPGRDLLTIDARNNFRIFDIASTVDDIATISGLTLTNGRSTGDGGAIRSQATGPIRLLASTISTSTAAGRGGGVFSTNSLIVIDSTIIGNRTTGGHNGGGVFVSSGNHLAVNNSIISGNSASSGGGLYAGLSIGIVGSTIADNTATSNGGGFAVFTSQMLFTTSHITVVDSTITGNTARVGAGFHGATDVTVTNGLITENRAQELGGGFSAPAKSVNGYANGQVTLTDTIITNNEAPVGGGFWAADVSTLTNTTVTQNAGGGFYSRFGATLHSTTVTNNTASGPGGGLLAPGGIDGLPGRHAHYPAHVVLNTSAITGNVSTAAGGGIYVGGTLTLNNSTVSGNRSSATGGGIHIKSIYSYTRSGFFLSGSAALNSSTVSGNESQAAGGGIHARRVFLNSSTVSGNMGTVGAGVYSRNDAIINDSTVTLNVATNGVGGGVWNGDDQVVVGQNDPSTVSIERSIVAENTATAGSPDLRPGGGPLTVKSSLIGDNAGSTLAEAQSFDANGNLIGSAAGGGVIDPLLAPLSDNGGPTQTHALLEDSPAIDAIPYYSTGPFPAHDYQLNNSLADAFGGPSLVSSGGTLSTTGYEFDANEGLSLATALVNPAEYSLELVFRWNALSGGWQKIIDFHNLASNVGLYTAGTGLHFLDSAFAPNQFAANTLYRLVLTRDDATDMARAYINGAEVLSFIDNSGAAVFDGPNQVIHFFEDDNTTGQSEAQSGLVDLIRIYNEALTPAQISGLASHTPIAVPSHDQRGTPFARVVDGDGIGGPQVDMGAYELQVFTNEPPVITSPAAVSVPENQTMVMTVTASDADQPPQTVTFSIIGGDDRLKFAITSGGELTFNDPPDFEQPTDSNGDNVYDLIVQADDGNGGTTTQAISVTVTPGNANPVFTSPATVNVPENSSAVMTVTATDADLPVQTLSFSIVGGADQARFNITSGGVLSFNAAPNSEAPGDANGDNVYLVTVQADDGNGGNTSQTIEVSVTPVNDNGPVFTSPHAVSVSENSTAVMTVTATDADLPAQAVTFSIVGGADQSKFAITPGGALTFKDPPDFDQPTDANGDNTYVVIVQASDGNVTGLEAILVTVTNVNDLTGDYNRNGTVDAADYVIWRKTLSTNVPNGTGADGNGDGVVDAGDHGVWRENFDRTEGEEAAAAIAQGSIAAADAAADEAAPLARSDEGRMPALSPAPAAAVTLSIPSRGSSFRTALRSQFDAAATRDDALLAWETARLAVVEQSRGTQATLFGAKAARSQLTDVHKLADSDLSCKHFAAFDCAIESLGL